MRLSEASFVVVDTETTGGRAAEDRIIEIGAVKIRGGEIVDRYEQLINPQCAVPRRITWLTGITTAMVFDEPLAADALPGFIDFLDQDVFVAHNLTFDAGFVNEECRRLGLPELANDTLCTLRLARRLLPGLRLKGLSSLADFYGIRIRRHHRALADAEATAEILLRFIDQVAIEFGIDGLQDLLAFQYRRYSDLKRTSPHMDRIREEILGELPEAPGVYFMKDGRGKLLYVGKAQNLQARVRSYFTSVEGHPPRIRKMVKSVRNVEWQTAESELDALILESRLIKELQPTYNRAHREYVNRPFIRIDTTHPFPRVSSSAFLHHDGAEYYGPLSGRSEAAFLVEIIDRFFRLRECDDDTFSRGKRCVYASMDRCTAPCETVSRADGEAVPCDREMQREKRPRFNDGIRAYEEELDRVRAFLTGADDSVAHRIESAMRSASADLDFEQAGVYRDWLAKLKRMLDKIGGVATRVLDHNAVVIHGASKRLQRLLVVWRGRHVDTMTVEPGRMPEALERLRHSLEQHFERPSRPDAYREREIDELYLLAHWLYVHRNEVQQVYWNESDSVASVVEKTGRLLGERSPGVGLMAERGRHSSSFQQER